MTGSGRKKSKPSRKDEPEERDPQTDAGRAPREDAASEQQAEAAPQSPNEQDVSDREALAEKERERQELVDRLQRLAADFSNYQKRMQRRVREERREALRTLLRDLLPVVDNFERALASAEESGDFDALFQGVRMVHDQLIEALRQHGVEPIEAAGRRFDPEHHEAVAHVPSDEHPSGHVIEEVQRGYRHEDRTLRASRVAVSRGPGEPEEQQEEKPREGGGTPGGEPGRTERDPSERKDDHADV